MRRNEEPWDLEIFGVILDQIRDRLLAGALMDQKHPTSPALLVPGEYWVEPSDFLEEQFAAGAVAIVAPTCDFASTNQAKRGERADLFWLLTSPIAALPSHHCTNAYEDMT